MLEAVTVPGIVLGVSTVLVALEAYYVLKYNEKLIKEYEKELTKRDPREGYSPDYYVCKMLHILEKYGYDAEMPRPGTPVTSDLLNGIVTRATGISCNLYREWEPMWAIPERLENWIKDLTTPPSKEDI